MMKTVSTVAAATKSARTVCPPRARNASSGPYEEEEIPSAPSPTQAKKAMRETLWKIFGSKRSRGAPSRTRFTRRYRDSFSIGVVIFPERESRAGRRGEYTTFQTFRSSGEEDIRYRRTSRLCSPPFWSLTKFRYVAARTKPIFSKARTAAACSSITSAMR